MRPSPPMCKRTPSTVALHRNESSILSKNTGSTEPIGDDCDNNVLHQPGSLTCLPAELLAQIFEYCLPQGPFPAPTASQAPLLLVHTCSYWRAVAFSTPFLWSRLHITYKDPSLDVPMTSDWLQRSGCLSLFISLSIDFNQQPAQELLDVICGHSSRWRHIRFEFRGLYCPPAYSLALAENNTPLLRAFEFDARDISSANISPIISLLNSGPNLREVTWVDDLADTRRLMELPLSRLTLLSITTSHGTLDYLELLDQCYNLEHIRITRPRPGDTRPTREPLLLSKLTSLNIAHDLTAILDSLVLPALKHVRIHSEEQTGRSTGRGVSAREGTAEGRVSGTWSPVSFLSLIKRSSCTVESLSLDAAMTESCLAQCLEMTTSSLTKLTIAGVTITDKFLLCLTSPPSSSPSPSLSESVLSSALLDSSTSSSPSLCPMLQEISLNTRISSTPGILLQMAESRLIPSYNADAEQFSLSIWDGHKDLVSLKELHEQHNSPSGSCNFNLDVLTPPRDVLSGMIGLPLRPRARRYISARRRICQSR